MHSVGVGWEERYLYLGFTNGVTSPLSIFLCWEAECMSQAISLFFFHLTDGYISGSVNYKIGRAHV